MKNIYMTNSVTQARRVRRTHGFLWLAFMALLLSCGTLVAQESNDADRAETRPRATNRDELVITFGTGDTEMDFRKAYLASEAQLFTALYEGLFSYHPYTMSPIPAIAASWDVSSDKKQWTFHLREDAKYANGDPVTAEDFRAAWLSLLRLGEQAPYSSLFDIIEGARNYRLRRQQDEQKVGVKAPDKHTLVVRLSSPASFFPSMLCHHSFNPIHPSMLGKKNWTKSVGVANGPFTIQEQNATRIVMVKNPYYWDAQQVTLNKLTIRFTKSGDEASTLWNSGEARWISGDVNLNALTDLSGISLNPMFATSYYFIRSAKAPWNDYRVRRALILALPWDEIRDGYYLPAKTLIYPIPGYPEVEGLTMTDTEESVKLLAEAGFPLGEGLPELVIKITPARDASRVAKLMAETWGELGVPVRISVIPYDQYFQALKQDDYNVGSTSWIGDFADPYTFLQMWRRDSNLNDAKHNDADYEKLMEKSMSEEGEQRWQTLSEAENLLLDRGSVLPISHSPALNIVDTDELDGWYPNALDIHPFKYLSFKALRALPGVAVLRR
ncbi:MAG: peptide ABC transporter substrate-binding protein [Treponema sp.]|jgi:peptide/nickel transport system substrate-binding protein/oligopeptide transport system substrate-binding protein|nr:peptide ABC transporter substrate-binding protein [Treponema sp.]